MSCTLVPFVRVIHTLTQFIIQKPIKTSLGNFTSLSGRIALCFSQSLSCSTRDSQKTLGVAIYSQIKSKNCQDLVKI